ncbi:MAG: GntR family transcriptional regulator [SAR324 cluster bacterium]|nr:GntR family transcriptional regulator [SAR324 cluster bacterium]
MFKEEKIGEKESLSVLDGFTLDREKLIGPQIYQFLLNAIVTVRLSPGIGLKEKEVIKRLGVSRTPIREALLRLEDEGLVQIFPQSGTYVSKIKIEAVLESQFIREALECSVARYAARNRNDELLDSLSRKLEDYETALNDDEVKLMYEKDEEFHRTLANFCFPNRLWKITNQAKLQMDRVRHLSLAVQERRINVLNEHRWIFQNIADGNEDRAENAMKKHLEYFHHDLKIVQDEHPDYFKE